MRTVITLAEHEYVTMQWGSQTITLPSCLKEIALYNMRPNDIKSLIQQKEATMTMTDSMPTDDMQLYYDDLFKPSAVSSRFYFIPDLSRPRTQKVNEPFVCFGGGGSTWP